jgi:hypothetical protein
MKRLLDLFMTVFPYENGSNRLIMDTEKVHGIKHIHVDVLNWANPINSCCDGPEAGHKTWIHQQGLKTNQGASSATTLMTHSLNKEASQLLCDAMKCRVEDGDARAEDWRDSNGKILPADRFWNTSGDITCAADNEGPCMGIHINIWELANVYIAIMHIICIIITLTITLIFGRFVVILCTRWWVEGASTTGLMPLITEKSSRVTQADWEATPSLQCYQTRLRGFCLSFIVFDIRASIFPLYQQTEATLMCMEP